MGLDLTLGISLQGEHGQRVLKGSRIVLRMDGYFGQLDLLRRTGAIAIQFADFHSNGSTLVKDTEVNGEGLCHPVVLNKTVGGGQHSALRYQGAQAAIVLNLALKP